MALDIDQIQLSDAQRKLLAEVADQTGKPWAEVFSGALVGYRRAAAVKDNGREGESVYDALQRSGLLGCLTGGPPDLSTNSAYMEGFGGDER